MPYDDLKKKTFDKGLADIKKMEEKTFPDVDKQEDPIPYDEKASLPVNIARFLGNNIMKDQGYGNMVPVAGSIKAVAKAPAVAEEAVQAVKGSKTLMDYLKAAPRVINPGEMPAIKATAEETLGQRLKAAIPQLENLSSSKETSAAREAIEANLAKDPTYLEKIGMNKTDYDRLLQKHNENLYKDQVAAAHAKNAALKRLLESKK